MKINEFTQLDEFITRASRIERGFKSYIIQNKLQPTGQSFIDYLNSKKMTSTGVASMLGTTGSNTGGSATTSKPKTATKPTPQKPGAGTNQAVGKQTAKQPQAKANPLDQQLNTLVKDLRGMQPQASGKAPPAQYMLDIQRDMQKAKVNKDWAVKTATKIATAIKKGYGGPALQRRHAELLGYFKQKQMQGMYEHISEQNLSAKDITKLSKQAAQDNPGNFAGFASGLRKGYKAGKNPLKTAGGAIADKFKGAADAYDKKQGEEPNDGGSTQDTRAGVNTLRTELGLENPAMAVKALEKLQAGKPLSNKNELNAVKPIVNAVSKALQSTQGRARLKQLIKTL